MPGMAPPPYGGQNQDPQHPQPGGTSGPPWSRQQPQYQGQQPPPPYQGQQAPPGYQGQQPQYFTAPPPEKPKRPWFKLKRTWFIGVPVLLFILMNLGGGGDGANSTPAVATPPATAGAEAAKEQTPAEKDQAAKEPAPAEALNVTADQLLDALESNALKASETYLNKRVRIEGKLSNIDASGKYFSLTRSDKSFTLTSIRLDIKPEHRATVMEFKQDQTVVATGTITGVGEILGFSIKVESIG